MTVDAVLFDLDGTLIDTRRLYGAAYTQAFADELDEPPDLKELASRHPSSERTFLIDWYGDVVGERIHQRMLTHYEAGAAELLGGFFDGVNSMIEAILSRGLSVAIVTGKSRFAYEVTRRYLDLSVFEVVVVEDDVAAPKPDPAGIRHALELLGASKNSVYVGDTPMDLEAAKLAGLRGAAALWSRPPADAARAATELDESVWSLFSPSDLIERLGLA